MANLSFTINRLTRYRINFSYDHDTHTGQPYQVTAWLEYARVKGGWAKLPNAGIATVRAQSHENRAKEERKLHDAINGLNLRPALRKLAIRAANKLTVQTAFNKETGRKLALARHLKALGWTKEHRAQVWDAYFRRRNEARSVEDVERLTELLPGKSIAVRFLPVPSEMGTAIYPIQLPAKEPRRLPTIAESLADEQQRQSVSRREREEIEAVLERMQTENDIRAEEEAWRDWQFTCQPDDRGRW